MQVNSRVQAIWLALLRRPDSTASPRIRRIEEGYYAVVHRVPNRAECGADRECEDFRAVEPFIPDLDRTRAVYLNQQGRYGLKLPESLNHWAGELGQQVERGSVHAFAVVNTDIFAQKVSAFLQSSPWKVKPVGDNVRIQVGRFTARLNLLRPMLQMVLSRSTFAEAARSVKSELWGLFLRDFQLFEDRLTCCPVRNGGLRATKKHPRGDS
jgi:hypothetical protein